MKTGYLAVVTAPVAGAGELDPSVELHLKKTIIPARRR
jgi:L-serine deaminase